MRIFLSYRREDSSAWAGRLRDVLASRVGEENVFQDVTAVRPGQDFRAAIDGALGRSDAVLAVIGPHWLTAASADGLRHLTDEHDHVRAELSAALRLGALIVPVIRTKKLIFSSGFRVRPVFPILVNRFSNSLFPEAPNSLRGKLSLMA